MINPAKKLQDSITVNGVEYKINTNFRIWLRFQQQLELGQIFLPKYLFPEKRPPKYNKEVREQLLNFLIPNDSIYPRHTESESNNIDIDLLYDWDYIFSSFYKNYGINLNTAQLHYHEYLALFKGLFIDYADVVNIRNYSGKDKDLLKQKFRWQVIKEIPIDDETKKRNELVEKQYQERVKKMKAGG